MTTVPESTETPAAVRPEVEERDICLEHVHKRYGDQVVIGDLSLVIEQGRFYALLGPSGCGKTTTLRMIGGFELPTSGTVSLAGHDVTQLPPHKREVNTVFQSYALFPHLTVEKNVAFGLERKKVDKHETKRRVAEMLETVQLSHLAKRKPGQLSGGQAQRVALARALVNKPRALLLDEPLGALDLRLRRQLQDQLKQIQQDIGITFVHVTHDQEEAMSMADTIAVMNGGAIEQAGSAEDLYERPETSFVANFLGTSNLIDVTPESTPVDQEFSRGTTVDREPVRYLTHRADGYSGPIRVGVRPEKVRLYATDQSPPDGDNVLHGKVVQSTFLGVTLQYLVRTPGGLELNVIEPNLVGNSAGTFGAGQDVRVAWDARQTFVVEGEATGA
ncbi:ABC transporter ATP-binding protein [Patulibacter minatonensis]|uniref:ABC transporter ATP-binding protein n=1 Tax=Patulibacter minatonensis TaxID=298163 RepID=UPI000A019933|nr:ABC transporter ATP-binding protein [Patulibacter minatonensis]